MAFKSDRIRKLQLIIGMDEFKLEYLYAAATGEGNPNVNLNLLLNDRHGQGELIEEVWEWMNETLRLKEVLDE